MRIHELTVQLGCKPAKSTLSRERYEDEAPNRRLKTSFDRCRQVRQQISSFIFDAKCIPDFLQPLWLRATL